MKYSSAYLWEKGSGKDEMPVSLLIQQVGMKRKKVLFACVCEGKNKGKLGVTESGYFTEGLVEWFHREGLHFCEKKMNPESMKKLLEKEVKRMLEEVQYYVRKQCGELQLCFQGILLWDNYFLLFAMGEGNCYLINRRFQKKNLRSIPVEKENNGIGWMCGGVQQRVGILLCTATGFKNLSEEELAEVLLAEGDLDEVRMEKRLKELWKENNRRGEEESIGAVYIRT